MSRMPNYWLCCGVMERVLRGGGVGNTLAKWRIQDALEVDAWSKDIARYVPQHSNSQAFPTMSVGSRYLVRTSPT
ncbi:MAG: hypothetical protein ACU0DW_08325 [Shimia sp.]